jgi:hypothetical protein
VKNPSLAEPRRWIRTSEAARLLGVSEQTVRRNAATRFNIRVRMFPGMSLREYSLDDVMRFKAETEADRTPDRVCSGNQSRG